MVRKLFKHEFLAWLRVMPIIYGITLAVAAIHRAIQIFENDSVYYGLIIGSASVVYVIALVVCIASATVFGIQRFYKNLFTGEGYLTHTLPVTPASHLWVKVLTAVSFDTASVLVCLLSGMIVSAGEVFAEVCKAAGYLLGKIPQEIAGHVAGYVAEYILLILVAMFNSHLLFYLCICVGQLFRKNRVLAAVGVYFGLYIIAQVLSTVMMVVFVILGEAGIWDGALELVAQYPKTSVHVFLCGFTVLTALLTLVYYWICHHIIRKRLNLE